GQRADLARSLRRQAEGAGAETRVVGPRGPARAVPERGAVLGIDPGPVPGEAAEGSLVARTDAGGPPARGPRGRAPAAGRPTVSRRAERGGAEKNPPRRMGAALEPRLLSRLLPPLLRRIPASSSPRPEIRHSHEPTRSGQLAVASPARRRCPARL